MTQDGLNIPKSSAKTQNASRGVMQDLGDLRRGSHYQLRKDGPSTSRTSQFSGEDIIIGTESMEHCRNNQDTKLNADPNPAYDSFGETKRTKGKSYHIEKKFLQFCRLLMYFITFVVVVNCGMVNKLSVLKIISDYGRSSGEKQQTSAIYLLLLVCVYPTFTLISSIFKLTFGKVQPLSKGLKFIVMLIESVHTVGILLLIFAVLPHFSTISSLYITSFLPIVPSILCLISSLVCAQGHLKKRLLVGLFYIIISLIQVGCFILMYFTDVLNTKTSSTVVWIVPIAVVLVSLSWWENFTDIKLPNVLRSSADRITVREEMKNGRDKVMAYTSLSRLLTVGMCVVLVTYDMIPTHLDELMFNEQSLSQTHTPSIIPVQKSPETVSMIPGEPLNHTEPTNANITPNRTCVLVMNQNSSTNPNVTDLCHVESLKSMNQSNKNNPIEQPQSFPKLVYDFSVKHFIVPFTVSMTFGVSYFATLACKLRMQRFSFSLATLLITPITFLYVCLHCANQLPQDLLIFKTEDMCPSWNLDSPGQTILFTAVWLSTCFLTYYIWLPKSERMAKIDSMFISPIKDCILVDYNLLLRRRNDQKNIIDSSDRRQHLTPHLYVCATMWHETRKEMFQLLKSLLRLDLHCTLSKAATKEQEQIVDPDKFEPEIHVIFDDAFEKINPAKPNHYVIQFLECLDEAATTILGSKYKSEWTDTPVLCTMPYGGRITRLLPGQTKLVIHLKNKNKIRPRKRWSQVMYMYYLLGFKSFEYKEKSEVLENRNEDSDTEDDHKLSFVNHLSDKVKRKLQNTFILTLDGDVDFKPSSVVRLLDRMKKNVQVGAVCGRIHPVGTGPVVWYQKFEYAIGHWLQKAAEHVLGCVLCCPGCFSLFRASALMDNNVIKTYTRKPTEALHYIQWEQGEDRWLCTLLLQQGYKIDYCAGADAKTFSPESFNDFYIQRRRWSPSTNANIFDLLMSWRHIVRQNADTSRLFMAYLGLMMATSILAPATVILLIAGSYSAVLEISDWNAFLLSMAPIVYFIFVCLKLPESVQLVSAAVLSAVYTVVMIVVTVGTILNIVSEYILSPTVLFLVCLSVIFTLAGLWHPREFGCLLHGVLYYVAVPSTFIFLTIYFVCNIHIVKWGTRENESSSTQVKVKGKHSNIIKALFDVAKNKLNDYTGATVSETVNEDIPPKTSQNDITERTMEIRHHTRVDWTGLDSSIQYKYDEEIPIHENKFWENMLKKYLAPNERNEEQERKIEEDLTNLRNNVVFAFFMMNFLFLVALLQLQMNREKLTSFYFFGKYEPVSVIFLTIFTLLLALQFFSMLIHRWSTFLHLISSISLVTCSDLSGVEKFKINYKTAKKSLVDYPEPDYDLSEKQNHRGYQPNDNPRTARGIRAENTNRNVYEKRIQRNFDRTARREYRKEKHTGFGSLVPTYGRSRHRYLSHISNQYHHDYNSPV